jgi:hypothetical protein
VTIPVPRGKKERRTRDSITDDFPVLCNHSEKFICLEKPQTMFQMINIHHRSDNVEHVLQLVNNRNQSFHDAVWFEGI